MGATSLDAERFARKRFLPEVFSTNSQPCCIGDNVYDSDALDQKLAQEYGIELIAPNRQHRSKGQDGHKLRRYSRRWKVERLFDWVLHFRLVTR